MCLGPDDHVELIEGVIVEHVTSRYSRIISYLIRIIRLFAPLLPKFELLVQGTLTVSEGQVYDPDFMLLRQQPDGYKTKLPDASDVQLVIEASESSFRRDQQIKLPVYAAAGIPEYWIADLNKEQLLIHRDPEAAVTGPLNCGRATILFRPSQLRNSRLPFARPSTDIRHFLRSRPW